MIRAIIKFTGYLCCYLIYPISYLFPRTDKILVFGSYRGAFNDNSKYLFLYANEHLPNRRSIWLSPNKETVEHVRRSGYRAYTIYSPKGIYYALRSKYWFVNAYTSDILFCLAGRAAVVNLWHGVPMKAIEFGITQGDLAKRYVERKPMEVFFHPACFRRPDYMVSTTSFFDDVFSKSFRISKKQCLHTGCPRNRMLQISRDDVLQFVQRYEDSTTQQLVRSLSQYNQVFVYMPTWRDSQLDCFAYGFDFQKLNDCLRNINACMLMKPHANTKISNTTQYDHLLFLGGNVDMYCILPFTDVLITDYSSILYDYLLMPEKRVILFHYDYDEYVKSREFIFPIQEHIAGKRVYSFEELKETILRGDYAIDEKERSDILQMFWGDTLTKNPCKEVFSLLHLS